MDGNDPRSGVVPAASPIELGPANGDVRQHGSASAPIRRHIPHSSPWAHGFQNQGLPSPPGIALEFVDFRRSPHWPCAVSIGRDTVRAVRVQCGIHVRALGGGLPEDRELMAEPWVSKEDVARHLAVAKQAGDLSIRCTGLHGYRVGTAMAAGYFLVYTILRKRTPKPGPSSSVT